MHSCRVMSMQYMNKLYLHIYEISVSMQKYLRARAHSKLKDKCIRANAEEINN